MIAKRLEKEEVFNPISLFSTIGLELEQIVENHHKDKADLLKRLDWDSYSQKERIKKAEIEIICEFLSLGDELKTFIVSFQDKYKQRKKDSIVSYKKSMSIYRKFQEIRPLLADFTDGMDVLEDIADFYGKEDEDQIVANVKSSAALYRSKIDVVVNDYNLSALLRKGEIDFEKIAPIEYDEIALKKWIEEKEWDGEIENVSYFKQLPNILNKFGVALSFAPFLSKTVYGYVRWIDGKPLIQITDRGKDLASCWFTLFHEFGHIFHHHNDDTFDGIINEKKPDISKKEKEANKFANSYLFNGDGLRKEVFANRRRLNAKQLAQKHGVHQLFAEYWLRKGGALNERKISIQF